MTYVNPIYSFSIFLLDTVITMHLKDIITICRQEKIILRLNLLLVLVLLLVLLHSVILQLYVMDSGRGANKINFYVLFS